MSWLICWIDKQNNYKYYQNIHINTVRVKFFYQQIVIFHFKIEVIKTNSSEKDSNTWWKEYFLIHPKFSINYTRGYKLNYQERKSKNINE